MGSLPGSQLHAVKDRQAVPSSPGILGPQTHSGAAGQHKEEQGYLDLSLWSLHFESAILKELLSMEKMTQIGYDKVWYDQKKLHFQILLCLLMQIYN